MPSAQTVLAPDLDTLEFFTAASEGPIPRYTPFIQVLSESAPSSRTRLTIPAVLVQGRPMLGSQWQVRGERAVVLTHRIVCPPHCLTGPSFLLLFSLPQGTVIHTFTV